MVDQPLNLDVSDYTQQINPGVPITICLSMITLIKILSTPFAATVDND